MSETQLRKHIFTIRLLRLLAILLVIISVTSLYYSWFLKKSCYATWVKPTDGTVAQIIESIYRAIKLEPDNSEGYRAMLAALLEDDILSEEEYTQFNSLITANQQVLHKNMNDTAPLYRQIAFTLLTSYCTEPQERLKAAYSYFQMAQEEEDADPLVQTTASVYVELGDYYAEYIWVSGISKEPSASDISDLLWRVSVTLDTMNLGSEEDRLAFACCIAALVTEHGQIWEQKIGSTAVHALIDNILMQTAAPASTATAVRLQEELYEWQHDFCTENEEELCF